MECDLRGSRFERVNLAGSRFERVNLSGAEFRASDPVDTRFRGVKMSGVVIRGVALLHVGWVAWESRLELASIMSAGVDPAVTASPRSGSGVAGRDGLLVRRRVPGVVLSGADGAMTVVDVSAPGRTRAARWCGNPEQQAPGMPGIGSRRTGERQSKAVIR